MTLEVISRKEALKRGLKRYFTGKPCKHGHISERLRNGCCVSCEDYLHRKWRVEKGPTYRALNSERRKEQNAKWYAENSARKAETSRAWRTKNPDQAKKIGRKWRIENADRAKEQQRKYYLRNSEHKKRMKRQRLKLKKCDPLISILEGRNTARAEKRRILDLSEALDIFKAQDNAFDYDADALSETLKDRA